MGCKLVGVECDADGLNPAALDAVLRAWDEAAEGCRRPRVLYTIPTGGNPTGATMDGARRAQLYEVAREWSLLILEDDPYHYLQFGPRRTRSLLSIDDDRRVLRFDSFSKLLSGGMRLGWVTGPPELMERLQLHTQASNLHTCGLSQALVSSLFDSWAARDGGDMTRGFDAQMARVAGFYRERRDTFLALAEKHVRGLAHWSAPSAGMFVWFRLDGIADSQKLITERAIDSKVLMVPGQSFMPNGEASPFVRAAYSTASEEDMNEALRRFGELLKQAKAQ
jgi:kynurenine/2-aminoadipate aminotransferase